MIFKKNGEGKILTNWRTIGAMATVLGIVITIITTAVNIGAGWGSNKREIASLREVVLELKSDVKKVCEKIPAISEKLDGHEKRLDKLEIKK